MVGVVTVFAGTKAPYKRVPSGGKIELFTDNSGPKIKGALGVGPTDLNAIASDARSMPNIPTGSQAQVIANNPYIPKSAGGNLTIMDYLPEAGRITQKGGTIVINGGAANKYLRGIPSESELSKMGLKLEYNGPLKSEYQNLQFKDSNGTLLRKDNMKTIIFKKVN